MRDKFIRFMYGRYGVDEYAKSLLTSAVVISVLGMLLSLFNLKKISLVCSLITLALIAYIIYRMLSKNINRRVMENHRFLAKTAKIRNKSKLLRTMLADRKNYRYVKCPGCKNYCRVPKGKGKIKITCRVCKKQFEKKV